MVTLEGKIRVPQPQREATLKALVEHVALTRAEDGCLLFDVKKAGPPRSRVPECAGGFFGPRRLRRAPIPRGKQCLGER